MLYELRTYRCSPGRLNDVVDRFRLHVVPLFERQGIQHVGFWTVMVGNSSNDFVYMLRWESPDERTTKWSACATDSRWQEARAKSEENGPLVISITNQLLAPTAFSQLQ